MKVSTYRKPVATIWSKRLWKVIAAMGWDYFAWGGKFNCPSAKIAMMLWPTPKGPDRRGRGMNKKMTSRIMENLKKYETLYAEDIANYEWLVSEIKGRWTANHHRCRLPDGWKSGDPIRVAEKVHEPTAQKVEAIASEYEARREAINKRRGSKTSVDTLNRIRFYIETNQGMGPGRSQVEL